MLSLSSSTRAIDSPTKRPSSPRQTHLRVRRTWVSIQVFHVAGSATARVRPSRGGHFQLGLLPGGSVGIIIIVIREINFFSPNAGRSAAADNTNTRSSVQGSSAKLKRTWSWRTCFGQVSKTTRINLSFNRQPPRGWAVMVTISLKMIHSPSQAETPNQLLLFHRNLRLSLNATTVTTPRHHLRISTSYSLAETRAHCAATGSHDAATEAEAQTCPGQTPSRTGRLGVSIVVGLNFTGRLITQRRPRH